MWQLSDRPAEYPFPATMQVDLTRFSWRGWGQGGQSAIISLQDPSCLAAAPRTLQSLANLEFPPTVEDTTPPPPQFDTGGTQTPHLKWLGAEAVEDCQVAQLGHLRARGPPPPPYFH